MTIPWRGVKTRAVPFCTMALAAYRHLLRSTRIAFEGDYHLLHAARRQARDSFNNLRSLNASSEAAATGIVHAEEVAKLLRHNIVQAKKVEGKEAYQLRIHEDTERGENDTVKTPAGGTVKIGKACS